MIGVFSPFFVGQELPFAVPTVGDTGPNPVVLLLAANGLLLLGGIWVFILSILLLVDRAHTMVWGTLATFSYAILFIPVFVDSLTIAASSSFGILVQLLAVFSAAASVLGGLGGLGAMLSVDDGVRPSPSEPR